MRRTDYTLVMVAIAAFAVLPAHASFEPVTCKNSFTVQQEIAEGNKVAAQVYQQMPVLPQNDPITRYVQQLGAKLAASAPPSPGTNEHWPYNFHVVASQDINAFALPGGSVFVNLGTVQAAETEAQLAGVMAHEISHVVMRHSTCNLSKQQKYGIAAVLGQIGSQIFLGNGALGSVVSQGIGIGTGLGFLHMSREDEKQADLLGVDILYRAGYDPRGLPQFFETIQAKYGQGGAQFLSDHPNPGNRTEYVNAEIQTLPQRSGSVVTTPQFKQIHSEAMTQHALTTQEVQAGTWKGSGRYASTPGGNGAVIPVSGASSGASGSSGTPVALSRSELGLDGRMSSLQTQAFSMRYPAKWQQTPDGNGGVLLAPPGGSGQFGIVYGALVNTVHPNNGTVDQASLPQATSALVQQLIGQNQGLSQIGQVSTLNGAGGRAAAVDLRGRSPLVQSGTALAERDWLVTFARPDGDLSYIVFVAPERDFNVMKPTFVAMLRSFQPQ